MLYFPKCTWSPPYSFLVFFFLFPLFSEYGTGSGGGNILFFCINALNSMWCLLLCLARAWASAVPLVKENTLTFLDSWTTTSIGYSFTFSFSLSSLTESQLPPAIHTSKPSPCWSLHQQNAFEWLHLKHMD